MKTAPILLLLLLAALSALPALALGADTFPLAVNGKTLDLGAGSDRAGVEAALKAALPSEEPSVSSPERLQYDYQAVPDQEPVTLAFDFGPGGRLEGLGIDAYAKEQNPVAVQLAQWLTANVGQGVRKGHDLAWTHAGFEFLLTETKDAGEDSMYALAVTRKTK
jgi:hypothetical protein